MRNAAPSFIYSQDLNWAQDKGVAVKVLMVFMVVIMKGYSTVQSGEHQSHYTATDSSPLQHICSLQCHSGWEYDYE